MAHTPGNRAAALPAGLICAAVLAAVLALSPGARAQAPAQPQAVDTAKALTIATIERRPFAITTGQGWQGFSIDLWRAIARDLNLTFDFTGAKTFPEMLAAVERGEADAAIANISITAARERRFDFSQPIFDSGLQIMVPKNAGSVGLFDAIFTAEMLTWLIIAMLLLFAAGNLMWFFERRRQPYFEHPYREGLWRSFWWALIVIVNGGFEERIPRSAAGRVFATLLVISSLFVVSLFVARITAAFTVGELRSQIQGYNDLYGKRVGTTKGSTSASFLSAQSVQFTEFIDLEALFSALDRDELDAVVHDAPVLNYHAATRGRGRVRVVGRIFKPEKYGIAFRQRSPLAEQVNRTLLKFREDGTYQALYTKWFGAVR